MTLSVCYFSPDVAYRLPPLPFYLIVSCFVFSRLLLLSYDPSLLHVYHIYNEQILFLLKILPRVVEFSVFFFSFL